MEDETKTEEASTVKKQSTSQINALIRTLKKTAASQECRTINSFHSHKTHLFHLSKGEKRRLRSKTNKNKNRTPIHDPEIEDLLSNFKTARTSKKYRRQREILNRKRVQFNPRFRTRRQYPENISKSGDRSRGSLTIIVFLSEDGRTDILLQQDRNDDGSPKDGLGFVIGGADSKEETNEQVSFRETMEEAGIPPEVGTLKPIGVLNVDKGIFQDAVKPENRGPINDNGYYVAGFVRVLPFNTSFKPGKEIYVRDGVPCQWRISKDELLKRRKELLRKHDVMLELALQKGLL